MAVLTHLTKNDLYDLDFHASRAGLKLGNFEAVDLIQTLGELMQEVERVEAMEDYIDDLKDTIHVLRDQIFELENSKSDLQDRVIELDWKNFELENSKSDLEGKVIELEQKLEKLEGKTDD
jgi:predicted nuclease with TOPRIM domain